MLGLLTGSSVPSECRVDAAVPEIGLERPHTVVALTSRASYDEFRSFLSSVYTHGAQFAIGERRYWVEWTAGDDPKADARVIAKTCGVPVEYASLADIYQWGLAADLRWCD